MLHFETNHGSRKIRDTEHEHWHINAKVIASHHDLEGITWQLCLVPKESLPKLTVPIRELLKKSDYPNVFFEPAFLHNSTNTVARHEVQFLILTEQIGDQANLKFFAPITIERLGWLGSQYFRVWSSEFSPLGLPLIDQDDIERTTEELLHCFHNVPRSTAIGVLLNTLPQRSAFATTLIRLTGKKTSVFNHFERASLVPVLGKKYREKHLSGKRRQRLNAGLRKLSKLGKISFKTISDPEDAEIALLDFLYMEKRGWKGTRKTALASRSTTRQLAIDSVRELAALGYCEIHTMYLDEHAISSAIVLKTEGYYFPWKITFDETYASYSVGNQLMVRMTEKFVLRSDFLFLDSLATGSNQTANMLWPDRLSLISAAIGFGPNGQAASRQIALNRSIMLRSKKAFRDWLGR